MRPGLATTCTPSNIPVTVRRLKLAAHRFLDRTTSTGALSPSTRSCSPAVLLFEIVTLPVEFDATARAKKLVVAYGIISERERGGGMDRVLNAAALTYVAAVVSTLLTLLYFLIRAGFLGGRDD